MTDRLSKGFKGEGKEKGREREREEEETDKSIVNIAKIYFIHHNQSSHVKANTQKVRSLSIGS